MFPLSPLQCPLQINLLTPSGTGNAGTASDKPGAKREVIDEVKDPCIKRALSKALGREAGTSIKKFMVSTFVGKNKLNLFFQIMPLQREISFNTNKMPIHSDEQNVATVYHKILHAYFAGVFGTPTFDKIIPVDHEYIASNYVNMLANDLRILFPNMPSEDTVYLAWGGLEGTNYFNLKTKEFQEKVRKTNAEYNDKTLSSTKGTYCK